MKKKVESQLNQENTKNYLFYHKKILLSKIKKHLIVNNLKMY